MMKRLFALLGVLVLAGLITLPFLGPRGGAPVDGQEKKRDEFASDQLGSGKPIAIDGKRAMRYLQAICDIGPRMSGTQGMKKQQELIRKHFEDLGCQVRAQNFEAKQTSQAKAVPMTNLIIPFFPDRERRIIICSHYDTRPIADQEPDPRKWREPFVSANDGGSGVALLMELGHHMKDLPTKVGVDFVLFDGEEYIFERARDKYFFGSEHFAKTWKDDKERCNYVGAVLLDMIAGKGVRLPVEGYSWERSERLCRELWDIAKEQRCLAFAQEIADHVQDDHLALLSVGIPAVDVIDFSYRHWHRLSDVPDNCSVDGMDQVARVLSIWMQRVK
jgi:hypothetical protein